MNYRIDQTANNRSRNFFLKKTLQIMVPISVISFLVSYFSVLHSLFFHPLQFYSSIIPFLSHALDRKCMFLICNGILAFLANNLKLHNSSSPLHHATKTFDHDGEDDGLIFRGSDLDLVAAVQEQQEQDDGVMEEEIEREEDWEEEEDDDDDDEEVEDVEKMEEVNDMRVSTEDLNKKFDEFIRKMKEEIRIEARQQYIILV